MAVSLFGASQVMPVVKNSPANAGDRRDMGSIPGSGRSPGGEHGSPLQYSYLENPMDKGAWWATFHGFAESDVTEQLTLALTCTCRAILRKRCQYKKYPKMSIQN